MTEKDKLQWMGPTDDRVSDYTADIEATADSLRYQLMKQIQQASPKTMTNHLYGRSVVEGASQRHFRRVVTTGIQERPDEHAHFDAREYERLSDTFADCLHHVRKRQYDTDKYVWFINPETARFIDDLFDLQRRMEPADSGIAGRVTRVVKGVPFYTSTSVPSGWVYLAPRKMMDRPTAPTTPNSRPTALIENFDDGMRREIPCHIGAEIRFRVVKK